MNVQPYGYKGPNAAPKAPVRKSAGYGFVKNPLFYVLALVTCCSTIPLTITVQFTHFAVAVGKAAKVGTQLISGALLGGVFWKIAQGNVSDRLKARNTQLLGIIAEVVGLFLIWKGDSAPMMILGSILYGNVYGLTSVILSMLVAEILPEDQYDTGYSTILVFQSLAKGTSVYMFGLLFDITGSHNMCFVLSIASQALVVLLTGICYAWKKTRDTQILAQSQFADRDYTQRLG